MASSTTQLSLKHLRSLGYTCEKTEHWNPFAHKRQDLFNFCDILCLKPGEILAVQTTVLGEVSRRRSKIAAEPLSKNWQAAGGKIVIHGWHKAKNRWQLREELV